VVIAAVVARAGVETVLGCGRGKTFGKTCGRDWVCGCGRCSCGCGGGDCAVDFEGKGKKKNRFVQRQEKEEAEKRCHTLESAADATTAVGVITGRVGRDGVITGFITG
jgi:hypothetical protein